MKSGYEAESSFGEIQTEQAEVQLGKFQGRMLWEYNDYIFPGQKLNRSSSVTDFLRPFCISAPVSLEGMLEGLCMMRGRPIHLVDMGGGRALPMRELATLDGLQLRMTNVDLFDYGLVGLKTDTILSLEQARPGLTREDAKPIFIQANAETVHLPVLGDIILSVESIQYLNNPLGAICNWYNQLTDGGLLIVATEHNFAGQIGYPVRCSDYYYERAPMTHFLDELASSGIRHEEMWECDRRSGVRPECPADAFRNLVIQKRPNTQLRLLSNALDVSSRFDNYKQVTYEALTPIVEVIDYATVGP